MPQTPGRPLLGPRTHLASVRIASGVSIKDLAARSGLSPAAISRIERGVHNPTHASARALARALAVTVDSLFPDGEEESA